MANHYSDPTANAAIGTVDHELKQMHREAAGLIPTPQNQPAGIPAGCFSLS